MEEAPTIKLLKHGTDIPANPLRSMDITTIYVTAGQDFKNDMRLR